MKIDILDEGYWSPQLFRGYLVMTSMTERGFGGPRQVLRGLMGQGEGSNQPTKGLSAPLTPSHVTRRGGVPHLGLPLVAVGPLGENLGAPPPPLPLYVEG